MQGLSHKIDDLVIRLKLLRDKYKSLTSQAVTCAYQA
jgi:hypothetical protein